MRHLLLALTAIVLAATLPCPVFRKRPVMRNNVVMEAVRTDRGGQRVRKIMQEAAVSPTVGVVELYLLDIKLVSSPANVRERLTGCCFARSPWGGVQYLVGQQGQMREGKVGAGPCLWS